MSSNPRRWKLRIRHILEAIAENLQYTAGVPVEQFGADPKTLKAVVWNLTTMLFIWIQNSISPIRGRVLIKQKSVVK